MADAAAEVAQTLAQMMVPLTLQIPTMGTLILRLPTTGTLIPVTLTKAHQLGPPV